MCYGTFSNIACRFYKRAENRMRFVGAAFKLRMVLNSDKERVSVILYRFHQAAVGRSAAQNQSRLLQLLTKCIAHLITVTVTLLNFACLIDLMHAAVFRQHTGISA